MYDLTQLTVEDFINFKSRGAKGPVLPLPKPNDDPMGPDEFFEHCMLPLMLEGRSVISPISGRHERFERRSLSGSEVAMAWEAMRMFGCGHRVHMQSVRDQLNSRYRAKYGEKKFGCSITGVKTWGMARLLPDRQANGASDGQWEVLPAFRDFVERRTTVPKYHYTWHKDVDMMIPSVARIGIGAVKGFNWKSLFGDDLDEEGTT